MPATSKTPGTFRDVMALYSDVAAPGQETPELQLAASGIPCKVTEIRGQETWRGRQLEAKVDFVIETWYADVVSKVKSVDAVSITAGWFAPRQINVEWVKITDVDRSRPPIIEIFCREKVE